MASVDGSHSLLFASDWLPEYQCGPCKSDNKVSDAQHFCQVCSEYLCDDCKGYHNKFKDLKNHQIIKASMLFKGDAGDGPGILGVKCNCNQALVEFFCEEHNDVVCGSCNTIKHRKCSIYTIRDKAASSKGLPQEYVLSKVYSLMDKIEHMQSEKQAVKTNIIKSKDDCKLQAENFQEKLSSLLDSMRKDLLNDLGQLSDEHITEIENQLSTLTTSLSLLKADCKFLEEIQKSGNIEARFAAEIKVSNKMTDYETAFLDIEKEKRSFSVSFETNTKLEKIMSESNLGTLKTNEGQENSETVNRNDNTVILDKKVVSSSKVKVQFQIDESKSTITGVSFMPNGKLLLADLNNNKVMLLDISFAVEDILELSSCPWDVTAIDNHTGIVTLPDDCKLQFIDITPNLRRGRIISTDKWCWSVKLLGDNLFVACGMYGKGEIRVLNVNGTETRRIVVNTDGLRMLSHPRYLAMCSASRKLYVSDSVKDAIFCLTYDGKVVYQYKNENLNKPYGLYVDAEDNILVCFDKNDDADVITAHGMKHASLPLSKDGLCEPQCLDYRASDRTLVVGSGSGRLYILKLSS